MHHPRYWVINGDYFLPERYRASVSLNVGRRVISLQQKVQALLLLRSATLEAIALPERVTAIILYVSVGHTLPRAALPTDGALKCSE